MIYLALLKRFWPFLVGAILLIAVYAWHRSAVNEAYKEAYKLGVGDTEDRMAEVVAKVRLENEKRERELALFVQSKQLELQVKDNANRVLASDVERLANESRLCLNSQVRRSAVPEATRPASPSDGTAGRPDAAENLGSAVTAIIAECQRSTDKLIVMQDWAKSLR